MPEVAAISNPDITSYTGGASQAAADTEPRIRALAVPFKKTQLIQLEDGDLLVKDWPMLLEGNWTDSAVQTPLYYPAKALEDSAGNWVDNSGWTRHLGGVPRRAIEKVAEAINPHYGEYVDENGKTQKGVISDIRVYGFTQSGRDMQEMIKRKLIRYVSVEHTGDEAYNSQTRQYEAKNVTFHGFAFVNKGACKACRINEAKPETVEVIPMAEEVKKEDPISIEAAVAAAVAPLQKELEELKAKPVEAPAPTEVKMEIPKELSELPEVIRALSERIAALENDGKVQTTIVTAQPKELEAPAHYVKFNRKSGIIG